MKKIIFASALLIALSVAAMAADDCPPLLFQNPEAGVCLSTPQPVCDPAPVCAPAPATASASSQVNDAFITYDPNVMIISARAMPAQTRDKPAKAVKVNPVPAQSYDTSKVCQLDVPRASTAVTEMEIIPFRKKVVVEESYIDYETHTATHYEDRVRIATRKVPVQSTKVVNTLHMTPMPPASGNSPRLSRVITPRVVPTTIYVEEEFEEAYQEPIKTTYEVPVTKTRKVKKYVDDYKIVTRSRR